MDYYGEIAPFYDELTKDYPAYRKATAVLKDLVRGRRVLEIGTGTGYMAIWLAQQGYDVVAIDPSKPMIEIAKKKQSELKLNITFVQQDVQEMNFGQEVDTIVLYEPVFCIFRTPEGHIVESYIHDLKNMRKALEKMHNHLKNEGVLLISVRDLRNESLRIQLKNGNVYRPMLEHPRKGRLRITHVIEKGGMVVAKSVIEKLLLSLDEFTRMLEEAGFRVIGFDKTGQIFLVLKKA